MKILGVNEFKIFNVRTDIPDFGGEFRRLDAGVWQQLIVLSGIGQSWEPYEDKEEVLEAEFQKFIHSRHAIKFPKQGFFLDKQVRVCFDCDTRTIFNGVVVRCDEEAPGLMIIKLQDGRHVLSTECEWQPV